MLSLWRKREPAAKPRVFVKGRAPTEPILYRFRPRETFEGQNGSTYVEHCVYYVREGNHELGALVRRWETQGKVEVL